MEQAYPVTARDHYIENKDEADIVILKPPLTHLIY